MQNNNTTGQDIFVGDRVGNGFVQNNNITITGTDFGRGFIQNNDDIESNTDDGDNTGNGFVQNNFVRGGWASGG